MVTDEQIKYESAYKRVKKIRGFYSHLTAYLVVNAVFIILNFQNLKPGESYFKFENFATAFFWGIGIVAHALSVFGPGIIFGKDWEERKIKQFMDEDNRTKQNWK